MSRSFSNDHFSIDLEEKAGCFVSATVKASAPLLEKLHKQAVKKIKKDITISGFRKGKAPDEVISSRYAPQVSKEMNQLLLQATYDSLSTVGDRKPLSPQAVKSASIVKASLTEGGEVTFSYEAFPQIPSFSWEGLSLLEEPAPANISDEEIEKGLANIAYFFATKTPVTRPSQEGDFISLSLHISKANDPEFAPTAIFENKYFKLSEEEMTDAFKEKFIGVSSGYRFTETIASPEIQSFLNGDTLTFTVNSVIEVVSPEVDDEKARQLQADSLEDLKQKLRVQLENQAKDKQRQERLSAAEDALAKLVDFDLPSSLLQERIEVLTKEKLLNARLVQYCSDEELENKKADLIQEAEDLAKKVLKLQFLSHQIFADEKLTISREELQHMMDICSRERFGMQPPRDISNETLQELVVAARDRLTYYKALNSVLSKAKELSAAPSA
ncbi:trigger factor [Chlamydia ibidis]|uniref:Trigger factor n=2 Tax=Chlamydia ibidis TaxID=1405396 RepID=S7J2T3_9CHLA|nr:trigger factor [Chlamydia ibidis]EPP34553.1 trigger factor [Chlamydia ibidis]EQM62266.1 trigger factor [Chlamydia ibidis 10-1398/6]